MITVKIDNVDKTNQIEQSSLSVTQKLNSEVDTASFLVRKAGSKTLIPAYGDDVQILDGSTKIFGGTILTVIESPVAGANGVLYQVSCVDYTYEMDRILASKIYENQTIEQIISDLLSTYAPAFTDGGVSSSFNIAKIVFNQIPISTCLQRLAEVVQYDWYVDADKDVNFFEKNVNNAPYGLTDTDGNYIYKTLKRTQEGSQVANRVKVRGGEYEGDVFTDDITVKGNDSKSFELPYRFANLTIELNTGAGFVSKNVGVDFIDDFTTDDVLFNFQEKIVRFENALADGDIIRFSGNPKIPVFAISEDSNSIASYGIIEKLVRDNSIESNSIARRRASAELYAFAEPVIDARFRTYTAGLRSGMLINIQSDIRGIDDDLLIKRINFSMRDSNTFEYIVELVSTKRLEFIALLQKIIEPDPRPSDASETSEEIFTDTIEINIQEEIDMVSGFEDDQTITSDENYILDPLGAGVNATYVLAPYSPTSQLDTKRPGRLDISLVVV